MNELSLTDSWTVDHWRHFHSEVDGSITVKPSILKWNNTNSRDRDTREFMLFASVFRVFSRVCFILSSLLSLASFFIFLAITFLWIKRKFVFKKSVKFGIYVMSSVSFFFILFFLLKSFFLSFKSFPCYLSHSHFPSWTRNCFFLFTFAFLPLSLSRRWLKKSTWKRKKFSVVFFITFMIHKT